MKQPFVSYFGVKFKHLSLWTIFYWFLYKLARESANPGIQKTSVLALFRGIFQFVKYYLVMNSLILEW